MESALKYDYHLCRTRIGQKEPREGLPGKTDFIRIPAGRVRVNVTGRGKQSIVLCPDPPHTLEMYGPVIQALAERFRVITFELPGFGYSRPARDYGFDLEDTVGVLRDVLAATETERVITAMPCGSGYTALRFAQMHPERVLGLVCVQTPAFPEYRRWIGRVDPKGDLCKPLDGQRLLAAGASDVSRGWLRMAENDRQVQAGYIEQNARNLENGACFCLASGLQGFLRAQDHFQDWRLQVPSAILWGAGDKTYRRTQSFTFAEYLNEDEAKDESRLVELKKVGHFPEMTRPDLLLNLAEKVSAQA